MNVSPLFQSGKPVELQAHFLAALGPGQLLESLFDHVHGAYYFVKDRDSRFMGGSQSFAQTLGESSI